jgi:hypothetical protein
MCNRVQWNGVQTSALPERSQGISQHRWHAELATFWHRLLEAIAESCLDWHPGVRAHALVLLHNVLTSTVEQMHLPAEAWATSWRQVFLPMVNELASSMQEAAAARVNIAPLAATLCLAVNVAHKAFVARAADLPVLREWRALWLSTLQVRSRRCRTAGLRVKGVTRRGGIP